MSLTNYAELQTAVAAWINRSDLTAIIPDFITLAESKLNRRLRTRYQEIGIVSAPITNYAYTIPTGSGVDVIAVKYLWSDTSPNARIEQKTLDFVVENRNTATNGTARYFAWSTTTWVFDASDTISGVAYRKVSALSSGVNWLITSFPDLYLYASLEQAHIYLKDPEGALAFGGLADNLIAELNSISQADQVSGGKLISRVR